MCFRPVARLCSSKRSCGDNEQDQDALNSVDPLARHIGQLKAVNQEPDEEYAEQGARDRGDQTPEKMVPRRAVRTTERSIAPDPVELPFNSETDRTAPRAPQTSLMR
jgi:hypothetical protein